MEQIKLGIAYIINELFCSAIFLITFLRSF